VTKINQHKSNAYTLLCIDLVKKYGPPVLIKEYTTVFRSGGQSIDVFAAVHNGVPTFITVTYQPINAAKDI
jgi:hypothetical protein